MLESTRFAAVLAGIFWLNQLPASTDLAILRSGVGITGAPRQLSGSLDVNGNGRRELLVADRWFASLVEEDDSPRGYHEVARVDAPYGKQFANAQLVNVPGATPTLLFQWDDRLELRDAVTLSVKATISGVSGIAAVGDVDGDGVPEIVARKDGLIEFLDPVTLALKASAPIPVDYVFDRIAVVDIIGDSRAEIVSKDGRAYTVERSGNTLVLAEVWNTGITGTWYPSAVEIDGHAAIALFDVRGRSVTVATFHPTPLLRTFKPEDGAGFTPLFFDANHDGRTDIILATSFKVRAVDMESGAMLWERDTLYEAPFIGSVYSPVAIDLDGDGTAEMAWADASYNSGVVAISLPLAGAPRWRSDVNQSHVTDWTRFKRTDGSTSIAYLTYQFQQAPSLGTLGFLDTSRFADQGGSAIDWLPGYSGFSRNILQSALTALPVAGHADAIVVAGAEMQLFSDTPIARWLWTFDGEGALLSSRTFASSVNPQRIVAAQVLDRPEKQLVVAGWVPLGELGTTAQTARVEVVDYATGAVLWQSALLPSYDTAPMPQLEVADLDADGRLDVVVSYGENVTVVTPAAGTGVVSDHVAQSFSLLDRGSGRSAKLATLDNTDVAFYDGISTKPVKTFVLPHYASGIALFAQAPDDTLMFATCGYGELTVQRYVDGAVIATSSPPASFFFSSLAAIDANGDHRTEIIGSDPGFFVWRLDNDYIFRAGFE